MIEIQEYIYHIVPKSEWEEFANSDKYQPALYKDEGFIHFSFRSQVLNTAKRYYSRHHDLLLLKVAISQVQKYLKIEKSEGGIMFPHLYSPLEKNWIIAIHRLVKENDDEFSWQEE